MARTITENKQVQRRVPAEHWHVRTQSPAEAFRTPGSRPIRIDTLWPLTARSLRSIGVRVHARVKGSTVADLAHESFGRSAPKRLPTSPFTEPITVAEATTLQMAAGTIAG